jgi:hypothetical protein
MIEIDELTPEQIAQLEQKIEAKKLAEKRRAENEIAIYKDLVKRTVGEQMISLQEVNNILSLAKAQVFGSFTTLIEMKQALYGIKAGQQGHSFSDDAGNTITLGYRVVDQYDDTVNEGISLVTEFIASLATDEKSARLVDMIQKLLKKDAKGNLKPNRVIELQNLAEKENNEKLSSGVKIILNSYKPIRSAFFIEAEVTAPDGKKHAVALSITSAEFPKSKSFTPNFDVFK